MARNKSGKCNTAFSVIVVVLLLALVAGMVIGFGTHFLGWFADSGESDDSTQIEDVDGTDDTTGSDEGAYVLEIE